MRPSLNSTRALGIALVVLGVGCSDDPSPGPSYEGDPLVAPEDPADIVAWANQKGYLEWWCEMGVHPGSGIHDGDVQVCMNTEMVEALLAGEMHHPKGAMAVKELYDDKGKLHGWAVSLKIETTSGDNADPNAWYWVEHIDGETTIDAPGDETCAGCHSGAFGQGQDYVLTTFPFKH